MLFVTSSYYLYILNISDPSNPTLISTYNFGFGNYANDNFTLKIGSPAFSLGFEQIDFSNVGPRG